jgi:hypothetical protein
MNPPMGIAIREPMRVAEREIRRDLMVISITSSSREAISWTAWINPSTTSFMQETSGISMRGLI